MSMDSVAEGEEPECLVIDDQAITLFCVAGTLNALGESSIGKLGGLEAIREVEIRIASQIRSEGVAKPFKFVVIDY